MKTIAIIGSCDTKFKEVAYISEIIKREGLNALVIDIATGNNKSYGYNVSREDLALAHGTDWANLEIKTKGEKIAFMAEAAADYVDKLFQENKIHGILSVGGLQNTVVATTAMQRLPIGFPKVMASTVASGKRYFESIVGGSDIVVIPSISDFTGINIVTRQIISNACACCIGMVKTAGNVLIKGDKPVVGVTLMGITNIGACAAIDELEKHGIEAIGFHTTGIGGATMEQMACDTLIDGILDFTIHEITSHFFGAGFSYNEKAGCRIEKAAKCKVPMVVCLGGLDFVDFNIKEFPSRMDERKYMMHNADTAHIKILPGEAEQIAKIVVDKLNAVDYHIRLLVPTDGMRHNTQEGQELYYKKVDDVLISTIQNNLNNENVEIIKISGNLDTKEWGIKAAHHIIEELKQSGKI